MEPLCRNSIVICGYVCFTLNDEQSWTMDRYNSDNDNESRHWNICIVVMYQTHLEDFDIAGQVIDIIEDKLMSVFMHKTCLLGNPLLVMTLWNTTNSDWFWSGATYVQISLQEFWKSFVTFLRSNQSWCQQVWLVILKVTWVVIRN